MPIFLSKSYEDTLYKIINKLFLKVNLIVSMLCQDNIMEIQTLLYIFLFILLSHFFRMIIRFPSQEGIG